ncbi:unnamed protein product [Trichogramma brassicae]|uniref:Uncharacterized protein n=1 Tax=Trichogramma brassicae TaxID=86971 RepID=A0A6H5J0X8_9HYME|nr:unnamed protein product [Trichogramma brassicae]
MITPTQFFHVHENPNSRNSRPYYVTINFKHMTRHAERVNTTEAQRRHLAVLRSRWNLPYNMD